jgi:hypothetical protein
VRGRERGGKKPYQTLPNQTNQTKGGGGRGREREKRGEGEERRGRGRERERDATFFALV